MFLTWTVKTINVFNNYKYLSNFKVTNCCYYIYDIFQQLKVGVKHQSINLSINHSMTLIYKLSISRSTGKKSNNVDMDNNYLKQHSSTFVYLSL